MSSETHKEVIVTQGAWTRLDTSFPDSVDNKITIRNISGTTISVYLNSDPSVTINDEYFTTIGKDPIEIGGLVYEISNMENEEVWVKAVDDDGKLSVRIYGTVNPAEDIVEVSNRLDILSIEVANHEADKTNPHNVTKAQVGLSVIPNAISDSITSSSSKQLATSKAVKTVQDNLEDHTGNKDNPHETTKAQVGLGNVPNLPKATLENCYNADNDAVLMTPKTTYEAVSKWTGMSMNVAAQSVVKCKLGSRVSGWSIADCGSSVLSIEKVPNQSKSYIVNAGLQVGYADKGKIRLSTTTTKAFTMNIPENDESDNVFYVYVDIDEEGNIATCGHTTYMPHDGMERTYNTGDFFNAAECVMYDSSNNPINRVYIGKVFLKSGLVYNIVNVPVGYEYIQPYLGTVALEYRALVYNPFIGNINTIAEIEYDGFWGPTYWNDQIGIMATPWPNSPLEACILQFGRMGYLANGADSGCGFGNNFETIDGKNTEAPRVRVRFTRKYR